ncbi:DUF2809 domain-containing protein [Paenibacillus sp. ClWae2A]|uniref:ribosomal maturation YjgA family protein n=1 Tax=Paenibacillus sp. ClWae2A TaxID=3057177 RepID=UPI0028F5231E|nr:DUF2809 domain-containing protein [Paenibacillus sp. ClWae2A]MDT9722510.1 DUF2809 domain-containing protein [Paenibacillus sp. ClWae2A]
MKSVHIRERLIYFLAVMMTMAAGLASRHFGDRLPDWVYEHSGDALWAGMIYFGVRMVWPRHSLVWAMSLSCVFSWMIEFSQLIQTPWLIEIRSTVWGALVLGHGFLVIDLIRYTVGILCMVMIDRYFLRNKMAGS